MLDLIVDVVCFLFDPDSEVVVVDGRELSEEFDAFILIESVFL